MREVLKPDVEDSILIDSMKDVGIEEVTDVVKSCDLELEGPALLEYREDDTDEVVLDCGMRRLDEVVVTAKLGDDCTVADVVANVELADA